MIAMRIIWLLLSSVMLVDIIALDMTTYMSFAWRLVFEILSGAVVGGSFIYIDQETHK